MRRPLRTGLLMTALLAVAAANAQQGDGTNYVELKRIAEAAQAQAFAEKAKAIMVAQKLGMPIRHVDSKSHRVIEIMRLAPNGMPVYYETRNKDAAITTRANRVYSGGGAGLTLNGSGIVFGVWDGGSARTTHNELTGRVTNSDSVGFDDHATHVTGTLIATGSATLVIGGNNVPNAARGMSFAGTVRSHDWNSDISEMTSEASAGTPIRISNHSYGPVTGWTEGDFGAGFGWYWFGWTPDSATEDSQFGRYNSFSASVDDIAVNAPNYLSVWAAGNDRGEGPTSQPDGFFWNGTSWVANGVSRDLDGGASGFDSISGGGVAKNTLTVGSVADVASYSGPGSVSVSSFSCWGPMDDGRIKPDVVGNGELLASTGAGANNAYFLSTGTSMASPNVAGSMGLLVQHYRATHAAADMRSSTLRGLVIHTADECGPNTGPDYMYGWGLMDTEAAAKVITDDAANADVIREDSLTQGQSDTFRVTSDGTTPLRFTLCWTDPAGTPVGGVDPSTAMLKHDLDMSVAKGATTYSPYMLNRNSPTAAATTGDNNVDNVEVIDIPAPSAGTYTITIDHDGTLASTQNYSLIVTGPTVSPIMSAFTINGTWITGGNSTNGTVTINTAAPVGGFKIYPRVIPTGAFNINSPVVIPEGQTSKTFPIVGAGNVNVNTAYSVWMDAGYKSIGVAGTMVPLRINALTVTPNPVSSGGSISVFIGLNGPAPSGGQALIIDRAPLFWIQAPTQVTIPQGQFGATFNWPITSGLSTTQQGRITVKQNIQPSGQVSLSKLFTINP